MILEIWITLATFGTALLILGVHYAKDARSPFIYFLSAPFLLMSALGAGAIDIIRFTDGAAVTETVGYGSVMMLFVALFLLSLALAIATILMEQTE